jgi:EAL domain-containing protein (putative c-di-GMP-specific phosphodiesterase class I)
MNTRASVRADELPGLTELVRRVRDRTEQNRGLGVLSVGVVPLSRPGEREPGWPEYDAVIDELSAAVRVFVQRSVRATDSVFGPSANGNGLVLLLDDPRGSRSIDAADVAQARNRLREAVLAAVERTVPRTTRERFGCFVGGAVVRPSDEVPAERLLFRALEEAFADGLRQREREERHVLANLRQVLDRGGVSMVYQPVVDTLARHVVGLEALTRVIDGRFATPDALFRKAREHDVLWRLERLCRARSLSALPPMGPDQLLFLNTEPDSLHDPELIDERFLARLRAVGLSPDRVVLEITEHTAVHDFEPVRAAISTVRGLGFRVAMDVFGAGYSGLKAVAEVAPDFIKIDMALVREVHRHPLKRDLIGTFGRFAETAGITLVAEGVESRDEMRSLADLGVRCAQGYLFARPSERPEILDWPPLRAAS